MRKLFPILLALLFTMQTMAYSQKKALLVGVSQYPQESGWSHINSENDIEILDKVLNNRGFSVDILFGSNATYQNITDKLEKIAESVQSGDTLLIHFSCLGQQMLALNDSLEPDGLDESIIPYDAQSSYSNSYKGDKHLKDDIISSYIEEIANRIGDYGLVVVTIDACHSDEMNRAYDEKTDDTTIIRGTDAIFDYGITLTPDMEVQLRQCEHHDTLFRIEKTGADIIYISACRSDEKNYECVIDGIGYGSLSYCIYDLLNNNPTDLGMEMALDSLYIKMKRFGRQHMITRNTLGYKPKEPSLPPPPPPRPCFLEIVKKHWIAFSVVAISSVVLLYLIWRKK